MAELYLSVGGVAVAGPDVATQARALVDGLEIREYVDGTPNTATLRLYQSAAEIGDEVLIGLDGLSGANRIFGGHVIALRQLHPTNQNDVTLHELSVIGYEWLLDRVLVTKRYTAMSATDIVEDLVDTFTTGFTYTGLEASLATVDEITFTNERFTTCLDRLAARIGGNWVMSYAKDLQFGLDILTGGVTDITDAAPATAVDLTVTRDLSQVRTRVYVEGGGSTCGAEIAVGSAVLPVQDASWYAVGGGTVAVGPQRVVYAGIVPGLGGSQVGTSVTPPNAPTVAPAAGTGVTSGSHTYKHTYVTASGETLPSPVSASVTAGNQIAAPSSAPSGSKVMGGNLSAGVYSWKVTYYDSAGGETTPSSASSNVTMDSAANPGNAPSVFAYDGDAGMTEGAHQYKYTFSDGVYETAPSTASGIVQIVQSSTYRARATKSSLSAPSFGSRVFYRGLWNGSSYDYKRMAGGYEGFGAEDGSYFYETSASGPDGTLGAAMPTSSTAHYRRATVTIPVSSDPATVGRKLYRTVANGSTWKLVATIANNTATSYDDNIADGSLGADAPSSNTATLSKIQVSGISAGPSGTTSRKLYRTVAGGGGNFKLVTTIGDNTTTTYLDATADGSLGADAPTSDTSALVQESGNVTAGSTSLAVTSPAAFESSGGWAYVGTLPIRYTGKSASALTGVPASGDGAIPTALRYGSVIVAAPMLTGIATSGTGSIAYAIPTGEPVNVIATINDSTAQTALAALVGGNGITEEYLQDNRLSLTEATARGTARLAEVSDPLVTVRYRTRDTTTRAGKTVTVTLAAPVSLSGTFRLQSVTSVYLPQPSGDVVPRYEVEASSRRFTFEQLLRFVTGEGAVS